MSTPRLPVPGHDDGTWGEILNEFLLVGHNSDGSLKSTLTDISMKADTTYVDAELAQKVDSSSLSTVATTGVYNDLSGRPALSSVATTGSYNDLTDAPDVVATDDARLSDTRTPTDNTVSTPKLQDASVTEGKLAITNSPSNGNFLSWNGTDLAWSSQTDAPVTSVSSKTGDVTLTKADVGLTNVDNTSDANKPVSTAVQTALDLKIDGAALANVAMSGAYADLSGLPTLPSAGTGADDYAAGNDARIVGALQSSTATTKGDLLVATGPGAFNRVPVVGNGAVLITDSNAATGVRWNFAGSISRQVVLWSHVGVAENALNTDYVIVVSSGSVTLPDATDNKNLYIIKNLSTNDTVVSTTASQTIDGSSQITLGFLESVSIVAFFTGDEYHWVII